jgi:hypothetical protein
MQIALYVLAGWLGLGALGTLALLAVSTAWSCEQAVVPTAAVEPSVRQPGPQ